MFLKQAFTQNRIQFEKYLKYSNFLSIYNSEIILVKTDYFSIVMQ